MTFLAMVVLPVISKAQQDSIAERKVTYFNQINSGILFGKRLTGNTISVSTVHGVKFQRWSFGAGLGYDTYSDRELMPVFVTLAIALMPLNNSFFFAELNYGYSKAWHLSSPYDFYTYRERGGRMLQGSVGYRRKTEKFSLYVKAGYKNQRVRYEQSFDWSPDFLQTVERGMERLSVGIGFGLN